MQCREIFFGGFEYVDGPVTILDIRAVNQHQEQKTQCIGQYMTLAPFDLFAGIIPANAPGFSGFNALTVDNACRRRSRPETANG